MRTFAISWLVLVLACGDDGEVGELDAGIVPAADAARPDANIQAVLARGGYLVETVLGCNDCHTPRLATGAFDMTRKLSGVECFFDTAPMDPATGCLNTRNLTNHATGLAGMSDAEIEKMMMDGVRPDGRILHTEMPYFSFHTLKPEDADAIVAYLRTIPGVDHTVPANQPPFDKVTQPSPALSAAELPPAGGTGATLASAERGRYLAGLACLTCHTTPLPAGSARPVDMNKVFQGGREFRLASLVISVNLTPHATGLAGWTVADIVKVLKEGKDRDGKSVCLPMPAGPMSRFSRLTDGDLEDLATYFLNVPPKENAIAMQCAL